MTQARSLLRWACGSQETVAAKWVPAIERGNGGARFAEMVGVTAREGMLPQGPLPGTHLPYENPSHRGNRDRSANSGFGMRRLWNGDLPLDQAFWTYAVAGGLLVNLFTSLAFMGFVAVDQPLAALFAGYGLSVPYNLVVVVGVWRAAGRHQEDPARADRLRIITLVGMVLLTVT